MISLRHLGKANDPDAIHNYFKAEPLTRVKKLVWVGELVRLALVPIEISAF